MIRYSHYVSGVLVGVRYEFEAAGETIRAHSHQPDTAHNVVVLKGSVSLETPSGNRVLTAGDIYDIDWAQPHALVALEAGTRIVNFLLTTPPNPEAFVNDAGVY